MAMTSVRHDLTGAVVLALFLDAGGNYQWWAQIEPGDRERVALTLEAIARAVREESGSQ